MDAPVAVRGLEMVYSTGGAPVRALGGIDLDVESGAVTLLVGPSGSGKTTLISILGCILRPTAGSVRLFGQEVTRLMAEELPALRRKSIGFVFQSFNLFPTLTAQENVELALEISGVSRRRRRARAQDLLAEVGLTGKQNTWPADLSGGEKQRVAIARALAADPPLVLADEPTAALDSAAGRRVLDLLRALARERQRTVVVVTHDVRAFDYADRVIELEDGRIRTAAGGRERVQ